MLTTIIEKHVLLEDRIAFLREKFEEALIAAARNKPREPRGMAEDIFNLILDTDPSRKKIYTQWIIKQYLKDDAIITEDFYKIKNALGVIEQYKQHLDQKFRDINRYSNVGFLLNIAEALLEKFTVVEPPAESEKEKQRKLNKLMHTSEHIDLVFNDSDVKIVIPKTSAAACYFGINTRWCTAANEDNAFDTYNQQGPLYIILVKKENRRFQFHFESQQFMNEKDEAVNIGSFMIRYPKVKKIFGLKLEKAYVDYLASSPVGYTIIERIVQETKARWRYNFDYEDLKRDIMSDYVKSEASVPLLNSAVTNLHEELFIHFSVFPTFDKKIKEYAIHENRHFLFLMPKNESDLSLAGLAPSDASREEIQNVIKMAEDGDFNLPDDQLRELGIIKGMLSVPQEMAKKFGSIEDNYTETGITLPILLRIMNAFRINSIFPNMHYRAFDNKFTLAVWHLAAFVELIGGDVREFVNRVGDLANYEITMDEMTFINPNDPKLKTIIEKTIPMVVKGMPEYRKTNTIQIIYDAIEDAIGDVTRISSNDFINDPLGTLNKFEEKFGDNGLVMDIVNYIKRHISNGVLDALDDVFHQQIWSSLTKFIRSLNVIWNIEPNPIQLTFETDRGILEYDDNIKFLANEADIVKFASLLEKYGRRNIMKRPQSGYFSTETLDMPDYEMPEIDLNFVKENINEIINLFSMSFVRKLAVMEDRIVNNRGITR